MMNIFDLIVASILNFFWQFLKWKRVGSFSNICLYSDRIYKTTWHCLKFYKSIFMNRSTAELQLTLFKMM